MIRKFLAISGLTQSQKRALILLLLLLQRGLFVGIVYRVPSEVDLVRGLFPVD